MIVFDSWAVLALFDDKPCASRVQAALDEGSTAMSVVNVGEVAYQLVRCYGDEARALAATDRLARGIRTLPADWPAVREAALVKARGGLSYADAFCVAAARRLGAPLWTGDPEIVALDGQDLDVVDLRAAS